MKAEYYVIAQERKTMKYGSKQHLERSITIPAELSRIWSLNAGQIVRLKLDVNGNVMLTKVAQKPATIRLTYAEWVRRISPFIPEQGPGKTYLEICKEAGIPHTSAPAIWVRQAEKENGLRRLKDRKTHRTLWIMSHGSIIPTLLNNHTELAPTDMEQLAATPRPTLNGWMK